MALAGARVTAVIDGIGDDQLDLPTPCEEWDVRTLYRHLFHVTVAFQRMARRESVDWSAPTPEYPLDAAAYAAEAQRAVEAWAEPGALDGNAGAMDLPAPTVAGMLLWDMVIHGWDLATATGRPFEVDDATTAQLLVLGETYGTMGREYGAFKAAVPIGDGTDFERVLASCGRDPR